MTALLDTSTLFWWATANPRLSDNAKRHIATDGNQIMVSAASAWEIATKVRIGKLPVAAELDEHFMDYVTRWRFAPLAISVVHARLAGRLAGDHKDPFDRMLAAQAIAETIPIVTNDPAFARFGCQVIW